MIPDLILWVYFFPVKSSSAAAKLSNGGKSLKRPTNSKMPAGKFLDKYSKDDWKCQECDERNAKEKFKCCGCGAQNSKTQNSKTQNSKPLTYEEYKSMTDLIVKYLRTKQNEIISKNDIIEWCLKEGLDCDNDSQVKIEIVTFRKHLFLNMFLFFYIASFL